MDHQDWRGKIARLIGDATGMTYEKRRELNVLLEQIALKHASQPAKPIPTICLRNVEPWPIVDIAGPVRWDSEGRLHIGVQVKKPNAQFNDDADMVVQAKKWYANQQPPLPNSDTQSAAHANEVERLRSQLKAHAETNSVLAEALTASETERTKLAEKCEGAVRAYDVACEQRNNLQTMVEKLTARIAELERWNKTQVGIITERDEKIKRDEKSIESLLAQIDQLRTERNVMHNKLHDISNIVTSEK